MRIPPAAVSVALLALPSLTCAESLKACEQVSTLVNAALRSLLQNERPSADTQLGAQLASCLRSHNICSVVYKGGRTGEMLRTADVTADLPQQDLSQQGMPSVLFLVRSIPRVRNDANEYCLVSAQIGNATAPQQWNVYGWVLAPNATEALPLQKQVLTDEAKSVPHSLRGLAAALWFFAQRMSGQPRQQE